MPYNKEFAKKSSYTPEAIEVFAEEAATAARLEFIDNLLPKDRAKLQEPCHHDGAVVTVRNANGLSCYHLVRCVNCGKTIDAIDSSG